MSEITIKMTNNVAEQIYGIMVETVESITRELKYKRILKKDGSQKKSRKYIGGYDQYLLDKLEVATALYKELEPQLDSFKSTQL